MGSRSSRSKYIMNKKSCFGILITIVVWVVAGPRVFLFVAAVIGMVIILSAVADRIEKMGGNL